MTVKRVECKLNIPLGQCDRTSMIPQVLFFVDLFKVGLNILQKIHQLGMLVS